MKVTMYLFKHFTIVKTDRVIIINGYKQWKQGTMTIIEIILLYFIKFIIYILNLEKVNSNEDFNEDSWDSGDDEYKYRF